MPCGCEFSAAIAPPSVPCNAQTSTHLVRLSLGTTQIPFWETLHVILSARALMLQVRGRLLCAAPSILNMAA